VTEAGGRATDLRGDALHYNRPDPRVQGILATAGRLHDELLAIVEQLPPLPRMQREAFDPLHPGLQG
jgi:hypothetical protein